MRLYGDLAPWFHLVTPPREYVDEADHVRQLIAHARGGPPATMLELGSGGGNLASHLDVPELVLSDLSPDMVAVSRTINPGREHVQGDMRALRLGRRFDAVLVHDAIHYMLSEEDLAAALGTVAAHLAPDGAAVLLPNFVAETFAPGTSHGGDDDGEGRGARYLEWIHEPRTGATSFRADFVLALRDGDEVRVEHDPHELGLFPMATWRRLIAGAGLAEVEHAEVADPYPAMHVPFLLRPA